MHRFQKSTADLGLGAESKKNYLSEADYLSPTALTDAYPGILDDPAGPVSTLVRLCNLTSFLYRVLSAAPAPDGSRPKLARASLESAALGFLSYVVPVDEPMHDGVLKQLVGIKCQVRRLPPVSPCSRSRPPPQIFLSALSNARGPLDPSTFFNQPLSAYFPALGVGALANRESAVRFRRYCESAVELIEQVGLDYDVLQTHWRWKDLVGELRSYCAGVARDRIGSESESGESLRAASEELDELFDENAEDETPTLDRLRSESVVAEQLDVLSPRRLQLQQLQEQQQRSRSLLRSLASCATSFLLTKPALTQQPSVSEGRSIRIELPRPPLWKPDPTLKTRRTRRASSTPAAFHRSIFMQPTLQNSSLTPHPNLASCQRPACDGGRRRGRLARILVRASHHLSLPPL